MNPVWKKKELIQLQAVTFQKTRDTVPAFNDVKLSKPESAKKHYLGVNGK